MALIHTGADVTIDFGGGQRVKGRLQEVVIESEALWQAHWPDGYRYAIPASPKYTTWTIVTTGDVQVQKDFYRDSYEIQRGPLDRLDQRVDEILELADCEE